MDAVLSQLQADGDAIAAADVRRLSPLVHKHLNFLGRYHFSLPGDVRGAEGEQVLAQAPPRIDNKILGNHPAFVEWRAGSTVRAQNEDITAPGTPDHIADTLEEALARIVQQLRATLEAEVLDRVREAPPKFLERVDGGELRPATFL